MPTTQDNWAHWAQGDIISPLWNNLPCPFHWLLSEKEGGQHLTIICMQNHKPAFQRFDLPRSRKIPFSNKDATLQFDNSLFPTLQTSRAERCELQEPSIRTCSQTIPRADPSTTLQSKLVSVLGLHCRFVPSMGHSHEAGRSPMVFPSWAQVCFNFDERQSSSAYDYLHVHLNINQTWKLNKIITPGCSHCSVFSCKKLMTWLFESTRLSFWILGLICTCKGFIT